METFKEYWIYISGYDNRYMISSLGRVKSFVSSPYYKNNKDGVILYQGFNKKGYKVCYLSINGKSKAYSVHRLVAQHFVPNIHNKPQVNHIDGIRANNVFNNLEWVTCQENIQAAFDTGLKSVSGEKHPNSKFSNEGILNFRRLISEGSATIKSISSETGFSYGTVWRAINKNYQNV